MEMKRVYNAKDKIEATMLIDHLKAEGIEAYCQENSSGEYMAISGGFSVFGTNLFVKETDEEKAKDIISSCLNQGDSMEASEDDSYLERGIAKKRMLAGVLAAIAIVGIVVTYAISIIE